MITAWISGYAAMWFDWFESISHFVSRHQAIATLVVVPVLTMLVTNKVSSQNAKVSADSLVSVQKIQSAMKIAEMRQAWISELRDELSEFCVLATQSRINGSAQAGEVNLLILLSKIRMRLNTEDKKSLEIVDLMQALHLNEMDENGDHSANAADFIEASQKLLKSEWDRLKTDLNRGVIT